MGLFNKKKEKEKTLNKEEIIRSFIEKEAQNPPSEFFVSGAVFDISRDKRELFLRSLNEKDTGALLKCFIFSYSIFLGKQEDNKLYSALVNTEMNDTNPSNWNADCFRLSNEDYAALLFMPIQNNNLSARIVGIVFSDKGDGYYYCMLNADKNNPSEVYRNKPMQGIHKVGEVKGLGVELKRSFLECIKMDYYVEENEMNQAIPSFLSELGNTLYLIEHKVLPGYFYSNPKAFFELMLEKDGIYKEICMFCFRNRMQVPFASGTITTDVGRMEEDILIGILSFPTPQMVPLCYRIYVISDINFNKPSFYTIEKGMSEGYFCKWSSNGEHLNFFPIKSLDWDEESKGIMQMMEITIILKYYHKEFDKG